MLGVEFILIVVCVAVALSRPDVGAGIFAATEAYFSKVAQKRVFRLVLVGVLALGIRLALLPSMPIPSPKVTDEFSYLLSGDTFAHGRLTNPSHPMWTHFETFQENWKPTYSSMYYPGFGLFLAIGQVALGHAFWGVWLSSGLMCLAICWALEGWLPPAWALLGSLLATIRLATFSYWNNSYWGGTLAAAGGALVIGVLPRIKQRPSILDASILAVGTTLILYTRPYEGLFFCLPVFGRLVMQMAKGPGPMRVRRYVPSALCFFALMVTAFAALGFYFWKVTGSAFTTPYQLHMRTYGLVYFPWQKPTVPTGFMKAAFPEGPSAGWLDMALHHPFRLQMLKLLIVWLFYFGPLLSLAPIVWVMTRKSGTASCSGAPEVRFLALTCLSVFFGCGLTIYVGQPHYTASLTVIFYAITLLMMRDLYRSGNPARKFVARSIPLICLILFVTRTALPLVHRSPRPSWIRTWCSLDEQNLRRTHLLSELSRMPGNHIVIVRYAATHDYILDEWVFNGADIDHSKVIWARDLGAKNEELIEYFKDRRPWLLEPDYNPPKLTPYER